MDASLTWIWIASAVVGQGVYIAGMVDFHRRNPIDRIPFFRRFQPRSRRSRALLMVGIGLTVFGGLMLSLSVENGWLRALTVVACFVPSLVALLSVNLRVAANRKVIAHRGGRG